MNNESRSLLDWVLQAYPDTPKTRAKQWIQSGRVSVAGAVIRKPHQLLPDPGKTLVLISRQASSLDCGEGWRIHPRVTVIFLDASLAVIDKGAGLISVPSREGELSAASILGDFIAGRLKPMDRSFRQGNLPAAFRHLQPLPVHRLDQYTTGLFCVGLNPAARGHLIEQVRAHTVTREYIAFVEGRPRTPHGTWRNWLQLSEDGFRQNVVSPARSSALKAHEPRSVSPSRRTASSSRGSSPGAAPSREMAPLELAHPAGAQEAITHFEMLEEYRLPGDVVFSKLRLRLETGRKHQIRIQAAHAGLPLVGDRVYNPKYRGRVAGSELIPFERQALHSETLALNHPERPAERMTWHAPLPKDLRQLEALLRSSRV